MTKLSQETLKRLIHYDPITGYFTHRTQTGRHLCGDRAEFKALTNSGLRINILGKKYEPNRLAFLYMEGSLPEDSVWVDHEDTNRLNNAWLNLRKCTVAQNNHNAGLRCDNTSGIKGVVWVATRQKWQAQVYLGRKHHYFGMFSDKEEARQAVQKGRHKLHGEFANHG